MKAGGDTLRQAAMAQPVAKARGSLRVQRMAGRAAVYAALIVLASLFAIPLVITVGDSLKSFQEVYAVPRVWIPRHPQWSNFVDIFTSGIPFHLFFLNTFLITAMALFGEVLSSSMVGYSFARLRWPFRDVMFIVLLSTLMLPGQVTMIPVFLLFKQLGWVNTWAPLIVPAYFGGGVFNIFLMRQFYKTIPRALEDAAKIDGCSQWRILFTIMMPLAKPAIATICVLGFIRYWNDFMGPLIYLSDFYKYTISLGIYMFKDAQTIFPHYIMAASLTSLTPVLILFFSAQRYFVKGIVLSGIKG
jgi:ABC-type glycerol-3-phosphate transport system permease component